MEMHSIIKLGLNGFAVVGIGYACIGTGLLKNGEGGWWDGLSKPKKLLFGAALGASILQTFF